MKSSLKKFDIAALNASARWQFLVITWILVVALYFVVLTESVSLYHCLSVPEVWLDVGSVLSPFFMISFTSGLLFVWAVVEYCLVLMSPKGNRKTGLIFTSILMFLLASWGVYLHRHWQMLEVAQGNLSYEDYAYKAIENKRAAIKHIGWEEFIRNKRCKDGIDTKNLHGKRLCELDREYSEKYGGIAYFLECEEPPKSRIELWKEDQDKFKAFMKEFKKALREEIRK